MKITIVEPDSGELSAEILRWGVHLSERAEAQHAFDEFLLVAPRRLVEVALSEGSRTLYDRGLKWVKSQRRVRTRSGPYVSLGPSALKGADYQEAVVVCSGRFPDQETWERVQRVALMENAKVTLLLDPDNRPDREQEIREIAARTNRVEIRGL